MTVASFSPKRRREPLTDTQLLMTVAICIFAVMYLAAVLFLGDMGFRKPQTFFDILNENTPLIVITIAMTIVMIGGGINISVAGVAAFSAMSCAVFLNGTDSVILALLLALGIGLAFGLLMGALISYLEIQPFIVTLAGMFLSRGLTTILSAEGVKVTKQVSPLFYAFGSTELKFSFLGHTNVSGGWTPASLRLEVVIALALLILFALMLRFTKLGRGIYALGGNRNSARMLGVNVKSTSFWTYVISGLLSGLAGFLYLMKFKAGKPSNMMARGEMDAIASAIIGGTLLTGGVGNVIGSFFGVLILSSIQKIVFLAKLQDSYWQNMASGALLGIFIVMQSVILSRRGKAAKKGNQNTPVQKE